MHSVPKKGHTRPRLPEQLERELRYEIWMRGYRKKKRAEKEFEEREEEFWNCFLDELDKMAARRQEEMWGGPGGLKPRPVDCFSGFSSSSQSATAPAASPRPKASTP